MIIGISGKIGSGKDTVGSIIQVLTTSPHFNNVGVKKAIKSDVINPKFINKKFADKLKDIVCLLIGCTREQLENRDFKEKELGEQWDKYRIIRKGYNNFYVNTEEEALIELGKFVGCRYVKVKMTPRHLLQLLGTECGRQILHPNVWVNSLMDQYKPKYIARYDPYENKTGKGVMITKTEIMPKWIITDMRFPNELEAVKSRLGISIKVERWIDKELTEDEATDLYVIGDTEVFGIDDNDVESRIRVAEDFNNFTRFATQLAESTHKSETALDNTKFDYVIENNGTIEELVQKVRIILTKEELL